MTGRLQAWRRLLVLVGLCWSLQQTRLLAQEGVLALAPAAITLEEVQDQAAARAVDVLLAQRDLRVATEDVALLAADLRPQLRLDATLPNYLSSFRETFQPDGTVQFRPVQQNNSSVGLTASQALPWTGGSFIASTGLQRFDDFENSSKVYNGSVVRVGYRQPLWAYNELTWRRKLVPAVARQADAQLEAARREAAVEATTRFFQLAAADLAYAIADSNVAASARLLAVSQERYDLGKISRGDLVQLELDLASAQQDVIRANQERIAASADLAAFIGRDFGGERLSPVVPRFAEAESVDVDTALALARRRRPEAYAAERRNLEAADQLEEQRRGTGFRADLTASIGLIRSDEDLSTIYDDPQPEQIVSLELSVPIVDWGRRRAIVRRAEAGVELARELGLRDRQTLDTRVRLAVAQYNQASRELELQATVRALAEERYRIARESYVLGAVPLTELTLARQARDQRAREYLGTLDLAHTAQAQLFALTLTDF